MGKPMILAMPAQDPRISAIQSAMDRLRLSNRWMAARMNTSHHTIGAWIEGASTPRNPKVYSQMLALLREHEEEIRRDSSLPMRRLGVRLIPVLSGISAGVPSSSMADTEMIEVMDWGSDRERWARTITGNSMSPLLEPGDTVVFEDRPADPGHVVHAYHNGDDTVKVLRGFGKSSRLVPVNDEYPIIDGKSWHVKGVAVGIIRKGPEDARFISEFPHGLRSDANR